MRELKRSSCSVQARAARGDLERNSSNDMSGVVSHSPPSRRASVLCLQAGRWSSNPGLAAVVAQAHRVKIALE